MAIEQPSRTQVSSFADAFKLTNRREVTIDVFVNYHASIDADDDETFDRRVRESLKRQTDRRYLV